MAGLSTTFGIGNRWMIAHMVQIKSKPSELLKDHFVIDGAYRDVQITFDTSVHGQAGKINSILIDGENYDGPMTENQIAAVFDRVQKAIENNTGKATLVGLASKTLTIMTNQ